MGHYQIAIIGAGFSGTMTAIHAARLLPNASIGLFERNDRHGTGLAYGTQDGDHLLNVSVGRMSAFPDQPDHFWDWLQKNYPDLYSPNDFAPRQVYGRYITDILQSSRTQYPNLHLLTAHITDIRKTDMGFELIDAKGGISTAERVVLALGNFPPEPHDHKNILNPYAPEIWKKLADDGDVLIVGTGLTSLDLVVTLAKTKPTGKIHLLSRHGLLPREHAETVPYQLHFNTGTLPTTALGLYRVVKNEIRHAQKQGIGWRSVIDALRPLHAQLWQRMDTVQKKHFLTHLRAYWDVHRHRCASQIMDIYRRLEKAGRLLLHRGPIVASQQTDTGWHITWRPRGTDNTQAFDVRHVVYCTGPQADFRRLRDPLVQNMLQSQLIDVDALALGIATNADYAILNDKAISGIYALGSVLKGRLYESVAVPELRLQAAEVAAKIAQSFS